MFVLIVFIGTIDKRMYPSVIYDWHNAMQWKIFDFPGGDRISGVLSSVCDIE